MPRDDNYPDDIRNFDHVHGSPFYVDPDEWMTERADKIAIDRAEELHVTGRIEALDYDWNDINVLMREHRSESVIELLADITLKEIQSDPEKFLPEPDYSSLEWD